MACPLLESTLTNVEQEGKDETDEDPGVPERRSAVQVVVVLGTRPSTQQRERVDNDDGHPREYHTLDLVRPSRGRQVGGVSISDVRTRI